MTRLCLILSISMLLNCGGEDDTRTPPAPDTTAPSVSNVAPIDGSTLAVSWTITVTFSESIRSTSLSLGGTLAADGTADAWPDARTLVISPATSWPVGAGLTLTIDATDASGNALPTHSLTYTVDDTLDSTPPTAVILPTDGATIATAQTIVVTFNESMSTPSTDLSGSLAAESDGGVWSTAVFNNDQLTISPTSQWSEGAQTLTLNAADVAGNPLVEIAVTYTVDTGTSVIDVTPPVGAASPSGGFLLPTDTIEITYNETMDEGSLSVTGTLASDATDAWNINSDVLTLSPSGTWTEGSGTVTIDADDVAGNPANTIALTFTVDGTAPTATESPTSGSFLAADGSVTITFNEAMDAASLVLGGDLAGEDDGGVWSATDTLVVSPATTWSTATGATLTVACDDLAGNAVTQLALTYDIDATPPTVTLVNPADGTTINDNAPLQIHFSESIDTGALVLGGTLLDAGYTTQLFTNDTNLRITPDPTWNRGPGQTLSIDFADAAGNTDTVTYTYSVAVLHVSVDDPNALPAGPGTVASPFSTIAAALLVSADWEIRVAAGTYPTGSGTALSIGFGRQVLGGYATDWSTRDPSVYVSVIGGAGSEGVDIQGGGPTPTILDGFTIQSGSTYAIRTSPSAGSGVIIHDNVITGTSGPVWTGIQADSSFSGEIVGNTIHAYASGIVLEPSNAGSCLVADNTIDTADTTSGTGIDSAGPYPCDFVGNWIEIAATSGGRGIYVDHGGAIQNNVIDSPGGVGLWIGDGDPAVQNNTIVFSILGVRIDSDSVGGAVLENNIFVGGSTTDANCVWVWSATGRPTHVRHNAFYDCGSAGVYSDAGTDYAFICSPGGEISNSCGGAVLTTPAAINNVSDNPVLTVDNALQASSPTSVSEGGNTIVEITEDIDGTARTTPYSMGAFEYD